MSAAPLPLVLIRRVAAPALGLLVIAYFVTAAVAGENGVMQWGEYRKTKTERQAKLDELKAEEARLAHRAELLNPQRTDPDLAEEEVKRRLGVVRPDEVIIELK